MVWTPAWRLPLLGGHVLPHPLLCLTLDAGICGLGSDAEVLLLGVDSVDELLPRDRVDERRVVRVEDGAQRVPVWIAQIALRPRKPDRVRVVEGAFRGGPDLVVDRGEPIYVLDLRG